MPDDRITKWYSCTPYPFWTVQVVANKANSGAVAVAEITAGTIGQSPDGIGGNVAGTFLVPNAGWGAGNSGNLNGIFSLGNGADKTPDIAPYEGDEGLPVGTRNGTSTAGGEAGDGIAGNNTGEVGKGIGQATGAAALVPLYAPIRNAIDNFQNGQWGMGVFNSVLAVSDVFLVKSLATAAVKATVIGIGKIASRTAVESSYFSVAYEMKLASTSYPGVYRGAHFLEANRSLNAAMQTDIAFSKTISELGIQIPRSPTGAILGRSPAGWVWHHNVGLDIMQLVPKVQHTVGSPFWKVMHPGGLGGFAIWGK